VLVLFVGCDDSASSTIRVELLVVFEAGYRYDESIFLSMVFLYELALFASIDS
jgi:hypothetical protein